MRISTKPTVHAALMLDALAAAVRREAKGDDHDPFDDAMVVGVTGLADAMKAESAELDAIRGRMVRLARQVLR